MRIKKFLAFALASAVLVTSVPFSAEAAKLIFKEGDNVIRTVSGDTISVNDSHETIYVTTSGNEATLEVPSISDNDTYDVWNWDSVDWSDTPRTVSGNSEVIVNAIRKTVSVTGVTLDQTTLSLQEGATATLKETVAPDNATNKTVTWSSSDEKVAKVDAGKVTAVKAGEATITVTTADGKKTATAKVTVTAKPVVKLNASKLKLQVKKSTDAIVATDLVDGDSIATWTSSNTKVATVKKGKNNTAKITAKNKTGKATITVKTKLGATASVVVTVQKEAVKLKSISVNKKSVTLTKKGAKFTIVATKNPLGAQEKVTFTSSKKSVATVNKTTGVVTAKKNGTTKITVKAGTKKTTVTVKVKISKKK